jgi:hypothetical protein
MCLQKEYKQGFSVHVCISCLMRGSVATWKPALIMMQMQFDTWLDRPHHALLAHDGKYISQQPIDSIQLIVTPPLNITYHITMLPHSHNITYIGSANSTPCSLAAA